MGGNFKYQARLAITLQKRPETLVPNLAVHKALVTEMLLQRKVLLQHDIFRFIQIVHATTSVRMSSHVILARDTRLKSVIFIWIHERKIWAVYIHPQSVEKVSRHHRKSVSKQTVATWEY